MSSHEDLFRGIYQRKRWAAHGVLSGDGSRLVNNRHLIAWLDEQEGQGMRSVADLGCGDLEWIAHCDAVTSRRLRYRGYDVVPSLIAHHHRVFPWFSGEAVDLEVLTRIPADIVIIKDVLPHLCNGHAGQILMNVNSNPWKRLLVTSHPGADNLSRRGCGQRGEWRPYDVEGSGLIDGTVARRLERDEGVYLIYERP